ncbi:MAG: chitosanase [Bryobacteraceae bacterium]
MTLTPGQKSLIERVVNVFETGTADGNYAAIAIFNDGPHEMRQITYGRSQTTEYGNLRELVNDYIEAGGMFRDALVLYADRVGREPLTDEEEFKEALQMAGREDPVMRRVQDEFFDKRYFQPAVNWASANGFSLALSALVIYDSFIHSGGILGIIRNRFPEVPPAAGGREKVWITQYVNARQDFLANNPRPIVRKTVYRTECLKREIDRGNWDLSMFPINSNGVGVSPAPDAGSRSRSIPTAVAAKRSRKPAKRAKRRQTSK